VPTHRSTGDSLERAEIVVIGAGAIGCAVAYYLARAGKTDVLVLEKGASFASATTAQAAGLVGQVRGTAARVRLAMESVRAFCELERQCENGASPAWRQVGSLRVALCDARVAEFRRLAEVAGEAGLGVELIDAARARSLWPVMRFEEVKAVLWCATDGYLQPHDLAMAYVYQARRLGVRFRTETRVEGIEIRDGRVAGVITDHGRVECEVAVNAAGAHAYQVARLAGLELPIVPVRHEYFVTVPLAGIEPRLPVVRIPDASLYLRPEVNALLVGGWEPRSLSADPREVPLAGEPPRIEPDWEVLHAFGESLAPLIPAVRELGVRSVFKGWPTFTPDGRFIVGESSRVRGFVMAGGCNAHGVSGSAGIGRHLVESLYEAKPSPFVKSLSPDRFTEARWDWETARRQAQRAYETYYALEGH
jgi:glycine/D-amino acid oxidase-like deaminating enzyme